MKSSIQTAPPEPLPLGTAKQAKGGYKAWENERKQKPGWRFMSPFRNRARMEEERRKQQESK